MYRSSTRWEQSLVEFGMRLGAWRWVATGCITAFFLIGGVLLMQMVHARQLFYKSTKHELEIQQHALREKVLHYGSLQQIINRRFQQVKNKETQLKKHYDKEACGLLFDQAHQHGVFVCSYAADSACQLDDGKKLNKNDAIAVKGPYEALLDLCTALHEKYPHLRCRIDSLYATVPGQVQASLFLESFDLNNTAQRGEVG